MVKYVEDLISKIRHSSLHYTPTLNCDEYCRKVLDARMDGACSAVTSCLQDEQVVECLLMFSCVDVFSYLSVMTHLQVNPELPAFLRPRPIRVVDNVGVPLNTRWRLGWFWQPVA